MNNPNRADVAVIIPSYNSAALLPRALESVLAQTILPREIIVVDDGSSDNTEEVARRYAEHVTCIRQPNAGCGAARNRGIRMATSKWVALLDADDQWLPEKLERQLACAAAAPAAAFIYCDAFVVDPEGTHLGKFCSGKNPAQGWVFDRLLESVFFRPSTSMIRRDAFLEVGAYDESVRFTEDYEFCLRLARKYEFRGVPDALVLYERQPTSMSKNLVAMARCEARYLHTLLYTELTHPQRAKVRRRLGRNLFNLAYEVRKSSPKESVAAAWQSVCVQPRELRNWLLMLKSLGFLAASLAAE
jgi:glycosyltransferase involved in cell wall biosynthesis